MEIEEAETKREIRTKLIIGRARARARERERKLRRNQSEVIGEERREVVRTGNGGGKSVC